VHEVDLDVGSWDVDRGDAASPSRLAPNAWSIASMTAPKLSKRISP